MGHHSSVNYVEPNLTSVASTNDSNNGIVSWKVADDYERAPRLEDYCITLNLEVEVCSRENLSADDTITSSVLIMSYKTQQNGSGDTVNFMGGTKIKCGNSEDTQIPFLTTNYADMYVGDLIDYGTTEMIGLKSIDIEYEKSCVPIISIKFTDVRGLSLFQPTELSRTNSYQGIKGINSDNVAQSFFQCFFRVPMPRFTITIKGFYGKPVTYEMLCDKFETNFNSNSGDFEVNTRFIGYGYSFLTDVSMDALLAAPYSDYGGKSGDFNKYWVEQINCGRFVLPNREKTDNVPMPTLYQIYENIQLLKKDSIPSATYLDEEEVYHEAEISELREIKTQCETWYRTLFNICVERYGKDYCFLYEKDNSTNETEYSRIVILATSGSPNSLADVYEQFPDAFKEMNVLLHSAISEYNEKGSSFKKLDNVSDDFSDYFLNRLFNPLFLNMNGEVVFNGFVNGNHLPETETVNNMFMKAPFSGATDDDISAHKKHILGTIYNDGETQYTSCYSIKLDYSSISSRIRALVSDSNVNIKEKLQKKRLKSVNDHLFKQMNWFPSVENFTKIMMAHLETMMKLMYDVTTNCGNRTAEQLGVTIGPDGNCTDVNAKDKSVPPFPRVTKNIVGEDNITKVEDTWVGEFNSGTVPFTEVDFIDGFFNGIEKINSLRKDLDTFLGMQNGGGSDSPRGETETMVKYPLTPFDLFTKLPIYGPQNEISNDTMEGYHFFGKVMLRMFDILSVSSFVSHYKDKMDIGAIARVEADNFCDSTPITNKNFLQMLRNDDVITPDSIIKKVTSDNKDGKCPWGRTPLFSNNGDNLMIKKYIVENKGLRFYPIQDISFSSLNTTLEFFSQGKISSRQDTVAVSYLPRNVNSSGMKNDNKSGFGNVVIMDDITFVNNTLENANNDVSNEYNAFYKAICEAAKFDKTTVAKFFDVEHSSLIKVNGESTIGYEDELEKGEFTSNYIGKFYGFNGDGVLKYDKSINDNYGDLEKIKFNASCIDLRLNDTDVKTGSMLLTTCVNDNAYKGYFIGNSSFSYLPKLCVLRIGAICFANGCVSSASKEKIAERTQTMFKVRPNNNEVLIVSKMSSLVQYEFARYFVECITKTNKDTLGEMYGKIAKDKNKFLAVGERNTLNPLVDIVKKVSNVLMKPILVVKLTSFATDATYNPKVTKGDAETYLKSFLERVKERYRIDYAEDEHGNLIKTTDEPGKTTDDMKSELYRYMKQLYDKWVPMSSFKDWQLESFFPNKNGEEMGHTFYFIDSYYNHIGDKLLVNPLDLANTVTTLMDNADINSTLLGFLADVYSKNRCMMYTLQNFSDLNKPKAMDEMFTPMSFNSVKWDEVNKYPSFVVVYPYEPSKNLNIANNEYNDDGFMLNDEFDTPKAIRSKNVDENTRHYRIPAFGVSYGKQYQSYFKNVNINMQNPVATQQSIKAKHSILQKNQSRKEKGVVGQDLYDIYATQSYTCNVEMMGCAWIQPLMYFVLLNIPMFRGSYLIMKVKHSIRPGDMTTTFTGCRMANVSNKIIEDIFTDDDDLVNGMLDDSFETDKQLKADIDNDCPYKVYPLWGSDDVELSADDVKNSRDAMRILIDDYKFTKEAAAGMCGNIYKESTWRLYASNSSGAFGLCQWRGDRKAKLFEKYGYTPSFEQQMDYINYEWDNEVIAKGHRAELMNQKRPEDAAVIVMNYYERPSEEEKKKTSGGRQKKAREYYDAYSSGAFNTSSQPSNKNSNEKKDVSQALFDSVNKSAQFTPSISTRLKLIKPLGGSGYYEIVQENGKNDKLHKVFDMMLNTSEYFSYIQELVWVAKENTMQSDIPPIAIYYKASESVKNESVYVSVCQKGHSVSEQRKRCDISDGNSSLLKSLAKKANTMHEDTFKKMVEQMKDLELLEKYKPQECETLFVTKGANGALLDVNVNDVPCGVKNGKIGDWNVTSSVNKMKSLVSTCGNAYGCNKCWRYVKSGLESGGFKHDNSPSAYMAVDFLRRNGFACIAKGEYVGQDSVTYGRVCLGDITVFDQYYNGSKFHEHGHIQMWCGDGWYSDYKTPYNRVNLNARGYYSVWRYTGHGKE